MFGKGVSNSVPQTSPSDTETEQIAKTLNVDTEKATIVCSSDEAEVSSNADSDFVDVPEMDSELDTDDTFFMRSKFPLPPPFLMNEPPDICSNNSKIEVVIKPGQLCGVKDDIFADIFDEPDRPDVDADRTAPSIEIDQKANKECDNQENKITQAPIEVDISNDNKVEAHLPSEQKFVECIGTKAAREIQNTAHVAPVSKMQSILNELDNEKGAVAKLSLSTLIGSASTSTNDLNAQQDAALLNRMEQKPNSNETTPKKIPQPFFVKKTPPSSEKKSPTAANNPNVTPSKAAKSLSEAFDRVPSTSSPAIDEMQSIAMAADVLREKKSKEELEDIAEMLNQERRDLAAERNKKDRLGVSITEQMSMECMELLRLFGVPYVTAPMEAEAQCAYLNAINLTDGTITDDSDIWLFGGQTVYKNFFDQNKHVLEFKSENIERLFHLDRHKLIQLSFLVGSDYTEGESQVIEYKEIHQLLSIETIVG